VTGVVMAGDMTLEDPLLDEEEVGRCCCLQECQKDRVLGRQGGTVCTDQGRGLATRRRGGRWEGGREGGKMGPAGLGAKGPAIESREEAGARLREGL